MEILGLLIVNSILIFAFVRMTLDKRRPQKWKIVKQTTGNRVTYEVWFEVRGAAGLFWEKEYTTTEESSAFEYIEDKKVTREVIKEGEVKIDD